MLCASHARWLIQPPGRTRSGAESVPRSETSSFGLNRKRGCVLNPLDWPVTRATIMKLSLGLPKIYLPWRRLKCGSRTDQT